MQVNQTDEAKRTMFLSWYNDFLTLEKFAAYHEIDKADATKVINEGRAIHEASAVQWPKANGKL